MSSSTPTPHGALIVFGSGPGIGRTTAALFATRGFRKIILLSRDKTRLSTDVEFVRSAAPEASVDGLPVDLADLENTRNALGNLTQLLEYARTEVECVLYNAGRKGGKGEGRGLWDVTGEEVEGDLRISLTSLYLTAHWSLPLLLSTARTHPTTHPALLVTSCDLVHSPKPDFFALGAAKAAQYNLVQSLRLAYEDQNVLCACVKVEGGGEGEDVDVGRVAEEVWGVFVGGKEEGEGEGKVKGEGEEEG